jgi:hypothetical protein
MMSIKWQFSLYWKKIKRNEHGGLVLLPRKVTKLHISLYPKLKAGWLKITIEILTGVYHIFWQLLHADAVVLI